MSCCAGGASSTGAVVKKTVALPQMQFLRNSSRSVLGQGGGRARCCGLQARGAVSAGTVEQLVRWQAGGVIFLGPCTCVRGPCPQEHGSHK